MVSQKSEAREIITKFERRTKNIYDFVLCFLL